MDARLIDAISNVILNANVIPDPALEGKADIYSVPIDDIDELSAAFASFVKRELSPEKEPV